MGDIDCPLCIGYLLQRVGRGHRLLSNFEDYLLQLLELQDYLRRQKRG